MANTNLTAAKRAKNDEFYTQYHDIEREMNAYLEFNPDVFRGKTVLLPCDDPEWSNFTKYFAQNFKTFGLKKLISTSYALDSKGIPTTTGDRRPFKDPFNAPPQGIDRNFYQTSLFELNSPQFDPAKTNSHGKIFVLTDDENQDNRVDINDLQWQYLDGDGDFRSDEVRKLRDEADIIITNPPFSLFREFLAWVMEAGKQFVIIGNINALNNKDCFPLIASNQVWLGNGFQAGNAYFATADTTRQYADGVYDDKSGLVKFRNCCWFTNIDHGRRHQPLPLMTMEQNLKFSKHKEIRGKDHYEHYDNYDAIEVPYTDAIPSDYGGVMGVPISFLDKYCPEQFEIIGKTENLDLYGLKTKVYSSAECRDAYYKKFGKPGTYDLNASGVLNRNGLLEKVYSRILIRRKEAT